VGAQRPTLFARIRLAAACFARVLADATFRAHVEAFGRALPPAEAPRAAPPEGSETESALALLGLLQREGRLVDFLEQDITAFEDAEVGAAARVVHEGCGRALRACATVEPVRGEPEESRVEIAPGFDPQAVKLTGNVRGEPPYRGALRHRGWRVARLELPRRVGGGDARVIAPAEVEL
jgi:hypothetical protein